MYKSKWNLIKRLLCGLAVCLNVSVFFMQTIVLVHAADNVVSVRLEEIRKKYPDGSVFNKKAAIFLQKEYEEDTPLRYSITLGGCNGLVGYVTMKVFHNPFTPETTDSYKKIGKASVLDASDMCRVFSKAKLGDVVQWSSGGTGYHYAIYLSSDTNGIYVYEANFGGKNKVRYNNNWKWENMQSWSHGAKQITVWRSRNYNQVIKKKAAKNLKKGSVFTINDITYEVTDSSITSGRAKVISNSNHSDVPKAIGFRYDMHKFLSKYGDDPGYKRTKSSGEKEYFELPDEIMDEQYFVIEK